MRFLTHRECNDVSTTWTNNRSKKEWNFCWQSRRQQTKWKFPSSHEMLGKRFDRSILYLSTARRWIVVARHMYSMTKKNKWNKVHWNWKWTTARDERAIRIWISFLLLLAFASSLFCCCSLSNRNQLCLSVILFLICNLLRRRRETIRFVLQIVRSQWLDDARSVVSRHGILRSNRKIVFARV